VIHRFSKNFLASLDTQKKLLHNLVSLLLTQQRWWQKPEGPHVRRWPDLPRQGLKGRVACSLTIEQPISVGAWNAWARRFSHEDLANKLYQTLAQNEESNGLFVNRSFFFEQAKRTVFHHFGDKERRLQELN